MGIEEIHHYHCQTGQIENVEDQFGPRLAQSEVSHAIEHDANRHDAAKGRDGYIKNLCILLKSALHIDSFNVFCWLVMYYWRS